MTALRTAEIGTTSIPSLASLSIAPLPTVPLLVVAPHPDDETIGCGGLIHMMTRAGGPVTVLIVSDGTASHEVNGLARIRAQECRRALGHLGVGDPRFGGLPDGSLSERLHDVMGVIDVAVDVVCRTSGPSGQSGQSALGDGSDGDAYAKCWGHGRAVLLGPAHADGHPDHDAVAVACDAIAAERGLTRRSYGIWMWTRSDTMSALDGFAWRVPLDDDAREAKRAALDEYVSQTTTMFGRRIVTEQLTEWARDRNEVVW